MSDAIKMGWKIVWSLFALPFMLVIVFCAFMAEGPEGARYWTKQFNIWPLTEL